MELELIKPDFYDTVSNKSNKDDNPNEKDSDDDDVPFKKKKNKKGGGFQSMGLSFPVFKGITKRGYKIPTPIQRKTIPLILEGKDVVAMARTGSGKTACFLIPMLERLKARTAKTGSRALILSPTRELALQTLKFIKEIGRYTGLQATVILGGDSMDNQFSAMHGNPDIIVATPGRFLHICVEMDLKLTSIEYIVFDEADRLFEMGFGEQLKEIVNRLPSNRQTLLFSATLPKVLIEFAKAGLSDPILLRLDVESKLPDELTLSFITCRQEEKSASLLVLLKTVIPPKSQTVIFAATKHHVEYIHMILNIAGISNTYIYSNLDPSARKINAAKFSLGKVSVLVVTDIAARGIDIPKLDFVINYNFPAKSKLFIHRVGRCARAGRIGTAYSILSPDEYSHVLDLHLFLGRPLKMVPPTGSNSNKDDTSAIGRIPQSLMEEQHAALIIMHENSSDLTNLQSVSDKAYSQYLRSRPTASIESNQRIKDLDISTCGIHPMFKSVIDELEHVQCSLLNEMKNYRPQGTIFEIGKNNTSADYVVMKTKRAFHKNNIAYHHQRLEKIHEESDRQHIETFNRVSNPDSTSEDIKNAFSKVIQPKKRSMDQLYKQKPKKQKVTKDEQNYIPHFAPDKHTEDGLTVNFVRDASKIELDLTEDDVTTRRLSQQKRWDSKKKKMVGVNMDGKAKKIKTESGVWIPASYKSSRYSQWQEKTKIGTEENASSDSETDQKNGGFKANRKPMPNTHWARHNQNMLQKSQKVITYQPEQILKKREKAEKIKRNHRRKSKRGSKGGRRKK